MFPDSRCEFRLPFQIIIALGTVISNLALDLHAQFEPKPVSTSKYCQSNTPSSINKQPKEIKEILRQIFADIWKYPTFTFFVN